MRPREVTGKVSWAESNQRGGLAMAGPASVPCRHQKDRAEARRERATGLQGTVLHGPAGGKSRNGTHEKKFSQEETGSQGQGQAPIRPHSTKPGSVPGPRARGLRGDSICCSAFSLPFQSYHFLVSEAGQSWACFQMTSKMTH